MKTISNSFLLAVALFLTNGWTNPVGTVSSDGEIAKVLTTINEGEIDSAKLELKKGKNPDAIAFAKMMQAAHEENMGLTKALAKNNSLDLKNSDLSKSLVTDADSANTDLKKADKATFDKVYVQKQIVMHQSALKVIDEQLLPKVANPNLKDHLNNTRTAVASHLEHAKALARKF